MKTNQHPNYDVLVRLEGGRELLALYESELKKTGRWVEVDEEGEVVLAQEAATSPSESESTTTSKITPERSSSPSSSSSSSSSSSTSQTPPPSTTTTTTTTTTTASAPNLPVADAPHPRTAPLTPGASRHLTLAFFRGLAAAGNTTTRTLSTSLASEVPEIYAHYVGTGFHRRIEDVMRREVEAGNVAVAFARGNSNIYTLTEEGWEYLGVAFEGETVV